MGDMESKWQKPIQSPTIVSWAKVWLTNVNSKELSSSVARFGTAACKDFLVPQFHYVYTGSPVRKEWPTKPF